MELSGLITELEENRNELLAESMEKYMQDKFRFLGIRGPKRTELYKKYFPTARKTKVIDWNFIETCWNKEEREFQYAVVYYLKTMQKFLNKGDISKLKYLVVTKSWWDTVDLLSKIIGDVVGKNVVIVDDMVDTAGTIAKAADIMKEAGALSVRACASHCVMSGPATERVNASALEEIVFTDSIPYCKDSSKVKQLSVADMFAETIRRVVSNESISSQYLV